MKKVILSVVAIAAVSLTACTDSGRTAETSDAKKVEVNNKENTLVYSAAAPSSHLNWRASHLGGMQKRFGTTKLKSAEVSVTDGVITNASILVEMNTLAAENFDNAEENSKLTTHLKSADFFDVDNFPTSKFELTDIKTIDGDYNSIITGNLTILNVTKSISFKAEVSVSDTEVTVKSEDFSVDRTDWGLEYNTEGTEGVPLDYLIANEVGFTVDLTVRK